MEPEERLVAHLLKDEEPAGSEEREAEKRFNRHTEEGDLDLGGEAIGDAEEHFGHEDGDDGRGSELDREGGKNGE